jgi:hypothetical protein
MAHYFPIFNLHACIKMHDTFSKTQHGKPDSSKIDMSTWTHNQMLDLRIFLCSKVFSSKGRKQKIQQPLALAWSAPHLRENKTYLKIKVKISIQWEIVSYHEYSTQQFYNLQEAQTCNLMRDFISISFPRSL